MIIYLDFEHFKAVNKVLCHAKDAQGHYIYIDCSDFNRIDVGNVTFINRETQVPYIPFSSPEEY